MRIYQEEDKLMIAEGKAKVVIEPWGANSLRVRMTAEPKMDENDWALTEKMDKVPVEISFEIILQSVRPPLVRIRQNGMRRVQRSLIISLLPVIHLPKSRRSILLQQEEHR